MDNSTAKKKLRELRKKANLTQEEMAERLGIQRTTYRNIESGPTKLINDMVLRIADILDKPSEAILSDYDLSCGIPAVLCERNEEYEKEIVSLKHKLSDLERENSDVREINELMKVILARERKIKKHDE